MPLVYRSPLLLATHPSPVVEAKSWIAGRQFPDGKPLIDVSQAAPADPPPEALRQVMADAVLSDASAHLYGPVLGNSPLRDALAADVAKLYNGDVSGRNVAITQGCNQAFAVAAQTIAAPGDEILLVVPWYFNHKMWLDMTGVIARPLPVGADMLPDVEAARRAISEKTRAIALVTPNNPAGVEYPPALLRAFRDLAREHGIALILDETYRDFISSPGRPHDLFEDPDWADTLIHLYSFSKAYRLTGHRVGAIVTGTDLLDEMEKVLDTVSISAGQIGQRAALWGLENLAGWKRGERDEVAHRRAIAKQQLGSLKRWRLRSIGAYFAWVDHPFDAPSDVVAKMLVDHAHVLSLPGTAFAPKDTTFAQKGLRIAFPNIAADQLETLHKRLTAMVDLPPM